MRSYHPEQLFDAAGAPVPEVTSLAPRGDKRMGSSPHANGGRVLDALNLPVFTDYAMPVTSGVTVAEFDALARANGCAMSIATTPHNFRLFCPDETNSNRLGAVFDIENRCLVETIIPIDDHVSADGRVMEVLSEHICQGWLEGYLLYRPPRVVRDLRGVRDGVCFDDGAARQMARSRSRPAVARARRVAQHPAHVDLLAQRPQRLQPSGPGLIDTVMAMSGDVVRVYLPPDANCLLSVADHCMRSRNYVNLIVIDKQPELQYLSMEAAIDALHARRIGVGLGVD